MTWTRVQSTFATISVGSLGVVAMLAGGCANRQPLPTQQVTDVEAASRSANELGAQNNPQAQLHLKLADEQLKQAKVAMEDGDDQGAERMLQRAKADAELALALTHGSGAQLKAKQAVEESSSAVKAGETP
jgi:hypothetical protein